MKINADSGIFANIFAVPCDVTDKYLKIADEKQLKVLLYILRNNNREIDTAQIASFLRMSEYDVESAIEFWQNTSIFDRSNNFTISTSLQDTIPEKKPDAKASVKLVRRDSMISPSTASKMFESSKQLQELYGLLEKSLSRSLTYNEQQGIIYIYKDLLNDFSVVVTLIKYCESINKLNVNYIIKVAEGWKAKGIMTLEEACLEINNETSKSKFHTKIYYMFHLKNHMTESQIEYVDMWIEKKYPLDLIEKAYENAIERIQSANFKYINTTLENWSKAGIKKVSDLKSNKLKKKKNVNIYQSDESLDKYMELVKKYGDSYE